MKKVIFFGSIGLKKMSRRNYNATSVELIGAISPIHLIGEEESVYEFCKKKKYHLII